MKDGLKKIGNFENVLERVKKTVRIIRKSGIAKDEFMSLQDELGLKNNVLCKVRAIINFPIIFFK